MQQRLIFHVDVNSAFLSWEAARRVAAGEPDLRAIPSAIGGDRDKRTGIILAKSIPAKKFGVTTGEPVGMALRKCPQLVLAPPDFALYTRNSRAFIAICRRFAPVVEQVSIDECFLDMTGTHLLYPDPLAIAHQIKDAIFSELGFTVNVGISENKLLAKMASDFEKPDKVHTLFPAEIPQKLWPLPVGDLLSVGRALAEKLTAARIRTIGDLARTDLAYLQKLTGVRTAALLHDYACGVDPSPVLAEPEAVKCYGNSTTLEQDVTTVPQANQVLLALCDSVAARLRADGRRCLCLTVTAPTNAASPSPATSRRSSMTAPNPSSPNSGTAAPSACSASPSVTSPTARPSSSRSSPTKSATAPASSTRPSTSSAANSAPPPSPAAPSPPPPTASTANSPPSPRIA